MKRVLLLLVMILVLPFSYADEAQLREDPEIKERFKHLASELRCLKCQNQTIYDSKAGLADDLRKQIRTQIYSGKSDEEIVDYMVARYGDFIRYKPAADMKNMVLWVGPFIFFIVGGILLIRYVKARRNDEIVNSEALSDEDHKRAKAIMEQGGDK